MQAVKRYWIGESVVKVKPDNSEVTQLKTVLGSHIDALDDAEAEIKDFLDWTAKANVNIPAYATAGLRAIIGGAK